MSPLSRLKLRPAKQTSAASDDGRPRVIVRTCKHILESGGFCQAAAIDGRNYCRAHVHLRTQLRKMARASRRSGIVKLPSLTSLQGVQDGLAKLQMALAEGRVEDGRAKLLRYALRQIATNLHFLEGSARSIEGSKAVR